jgi:hypothetical protein
MKPLSRETTTCPEVITAPLVLGAHDRKAFTLFLFVFEPRSDEAI